MLEVVLGRGLGEHRVLDQDHDDHDASSNNMPSEASEASETSVNEPGQSETPFNEQQANVVKYMSDMRASSPDILRATWAYCALAVCGQALRGRNDLHHLSFATTRIQQFWSHSWHGGKWMKVLTVIFLQNGTAAFFVSTFGAFIAMVLVVLGILPPYQAPDDVVFAGCNWCTSFGLVLYCLTILFWRRRFSIFLDVICIDQEDEKRKTRGILSMGGSLKSSESMLVLWDSSYVHRLWCVWELAGFLHAHSGDPKPKIIIKPTVAGAAYIIQTLAVAVGAVIISSIPDRGRETRAFTAYMMAGIVACCGYAVAAMCRNYFRSIEALCKQLENFTTDSATCSCCTSGHPEGQTCDRSILLQCISIWFGNVEAFERSVRTRLLNLLASGLWNELFRYKRCVAGTVPILWQICERIAVDVHFGSGEKYLEHIFFQLIRGFAWWLGCFPIMFFTLLVLARFLRRRRSMPLEILTNLLVMVGPVSVFLAMQALEQVGWTLTTHLKGLYWGYLVITPLTILLSWFCYGCFHLLEK